MNLKFFNFIISITLITSGSSISVALPPPEDIPEEISRTEIITEGRSRLDNQALSASDYQQLEAELAKSKYPPELSSKIQHLIFSLELLKLRRLINPFE